jgi:hypothetical protein
MIVSISEIPKPRGLYLPETTLEAGKVIKKGETTSIVAIPIKDKTKLIVQLLEVANEFIQEIADKASNIYQLVKELFSTMPYIIRDIELNSYFLTKRLAPANGIYKSIYSYETVAFENGNMPVGSVGREWKIKVLSQFIESTPKKAKKAMRQWLKEKNYM